MILAIYDFARSCYSAVSVSLLDTVYPLIAVTSLVPVSCSTLHHRTTLLWILLTTTTLDSPQDLFTLSTQLTPISVSTSVFSATHPSFPGSALHSSLCNKYFGSFIPVSSSESALEFPCVAPLNYTVLHDCTGFTNPS